MTPITKTENSSIYQAIAYREELAKMPCGFFPFPEEQSKKWKVCFKRFLSSKPETIEDTLTEKAAKKKAAALNLVINPLG
jgi:hypothetical protein